AGFDDGIDNRKVSAMLVSGNKHLSAGTLFGLFYYDDDSNRWKKLDLPVEDERIQWLVEKEGSVMILTRSELLQAKDDPSNFSPRQLDLPPPEGYDNKAGLFRTIWVIHSGELYGLAGKLVVDALGVVTIILAITGALHFAMPYTLRKLKKQQKSLKLASSTKRTSATWHKKAGIWIALFLLINTITGMFLRPPFLITIANARVGKIPWSMLDSPNPWEDKLRALIYDEEINGYILGTSEGLYYADGALAREMTPLPGQPPLSVMGINVFQKTGPGKYLVGSFNGLYDWDLRAGVPLDHLTGRYAVDRNTGSKPFGEHMVSGYVKLDNREEICFDYNRGAFSNPETEMPSMPREILEASPMSWWNVALEVHTGRIFKPLVGDLYILIVPLMGIFGTILVVTGVIVWIKLYVRKNR
ncbi:MAG: PepSY domain-containing protein, partial [Bacteroidales bacterium]|nr:PepSY domain-containing protein [Bacteroidales bacterium]